MAFWGFFIYVRPSSLLEWVSRLLALALRAGLVNNPVGFTKKITILKEFPRVWRPFSRRLASTFTFNKRERRVGGPGIMTSCHREDYFSYADRNNPLHNILGIR